MSEVKRFKELAYKHKDVLDEIRKKYGATIEGGFNLMAFYARRIIYNNERPDLLTPNRDDEES